VAGGPDSGGRQHGLGGLQRCQALPNVPKWDGVQMTPEEIECEQNYREAPRNSWLAPKGDELRRRLGSYR